MGKRKEKTMETRVRQQRRETSDIEQMIFDELDARDDSEEAPEAYRLMFELHDGQTGITYAHTLTGLEMIGKEIERSGNQVTDLVADKEYAKLGTLTTMETDNPQSIIADNKGR